MNDGLDYIREAIRQKGDAAKVEVVRWEKDTRTGYINRPFKVLIKADVALAQLTTPINKRSRVWKFIRPLGMTMDGMISEPKGANALNSPELIEQLKAELRAELQAEFAQPKRTKKAKPEASITEEIETETTDLENA